MTGHLPLSLDRLPYRQPARVSAVDWAALSAPEERRLRNLGLDDGVVIETLHGGPFGRDPIAVRVGALTLAMRRAHARVIMVVAVEEGEAAAA